MEAVNIYPEFISWKKNKQGLAPIAIRIDLNGKRVATKTFPHRIAQHHWDLKERRVYDAHPDSALMNQILAAHQQQFKSYVIRRQAFGLPVTAEQLKRLLEKGGAADDFFGYAEDVLEQKTLHDGKGYDPETKRRYRDELKRLQQYHSPLSFDKMTVDFLRGYKLWLQNTYTKKDGQHLAKNGVWNAFKFVRMVWNEAVRAQVVLPEQNPFRSFKVDGFEQDTSKIKFLELSDVQALEKVLKEADGLQPLTIKIGWRFLAMCVCGMRISDAMALSEAYFNDAGDLEFRPHKTRRFNNRAQIPVVSERQRFYLQMALSMKLPETDAKSFRTTFNIHLKILAAKAGVNVNLTSHVGRHTMGSFLVDAGVEKQAAKAMLGIKSDKVIETYLHLKKSKLQSEAQKLKGVF